VASAAIAIRPSTSSSSSAPAKRVAPSRCERGARRLSSVTSTLAKRSEFTARRDELGARSASLQRMRSRTDARLGMRVATRRMTSDDGLTRRLDRFSFDSG